MSKLKPVADTHTSLEHNACDLSISGSLNLFKATAQSEKIITLRSLRI
jgi:hypothetical protein